MSGSVPMNVTVGEGVRRLPIYLLLDCSGSMNGAPIEAVRRGVEEFVREARNDPYARQTVHVGVIVFGSTTAMVTKGLEPIESFQPPAITAGSTTPLGQALRILQESLDRDLKPSVVGGEKGDWKPLVFILTDGQPTDDWQTPRAELLARQQNKLVNIITVGCGPYIDEATLKAIAVGPTFRMDAADASFKAFFQWVTQSVKAVSKAVSQPGAGAAPGQLPNPNPAVIQYVP
ncbi:MAG: vWA domain-containing protein [Chthonomonadales bacterium]